MCDPILPTLMKMQPHYSQSSHENANSSSGRLPITRKCGDLISAAIERLQIEPILVVIYGLH